METTAPPVLLLSPDLQRAQERRHRPKDATEYHLSGDFLVHCHVEMHMMQGLVALAPDCLADARAGARPRHKDRPGN